MKTMTTHAHIDGDGMLSLSVETNLPPGAARVDLVIRPDASAQPTTPGKSFASLRGTWAGLLPDDDIERDLENMNREWKAKLESVE